MKFFYLLLFFIAFSLKINGQTYFSNFSNLNDSVEIKKGKLIFYQKKTDEIFHYIYIIADNRATFIISDAYLFQNKKVIFESFYMLPKLKKMRVKFDCYSLEIIETKEKKFFFKIVEIKKKFVNS